MTYILLLAFVLNGQTELVIKHYPTLVECELAAAKIMRSNPKYRNHICMQQSKGYI